MKNFYSAICISMLAYGVPASSVAQNNVTITGDTCMQSTLTAHIKNGTPKLIRWYKDDTTLALARAPWNPESVIVAGGHGDGLGSNQLSAPEAIFIDKAFNLYIVDNLRIQKWAKNADTGITVAGGNGKGSALNQFYAPTGVWVDGKKNVYVSDYLTNRVVKWAPGATTGVIVAGGNGFGSDANQLAGAGQICMDKQGNLYIADRWNDRVQKWAKGATAGTTVAGGNGRGKAANQLSQPYSIALDTSVNLYVADAYNNRIQKWAPGATSGVTVAGGKGPGINADQLNIASAVHVDTAGNIYVVDNANYRIQKWAPGADYGITIAGGHGMGAASNQMSSAYGITVDKTGNVYLSEIGEERVKKFMPSGTIDSVFVPREPGGYKAAVTFNDEHVSQSKTYHLLAIPEKLGGIQGPKEVTENQQSVQYRVRNRYPGIYYDWQVPPGSDIVAGQGTDEITVNFGTNAGTITVLASNFCGTASHPAKKEIIVSPAAIVVNQKRIPFTSQLTVYPNPASGKVSVIFFSDKSGKYNVDLTDASGRLLQQQANTAVPGTNTANLDVTGYAKGTYFIRLSNLQKGKQTVKLYKE